MSQKIDRNRLLECRKAVGLSQVEAAKQMQMSQPAYARYESGTREPSIHVLKVIAETFGTSVEYLTGVAKKSSPSIVTVQKADEPELFRIVTDCRNDEAKMNRLFAYYKKINGSK